MPSYLPTWPYTFWIMSYEVMCYKSDLKRIACCLSTSGQWIHTSPLNISAYEGTNGGREFFGGGRATSFPTKEVTCQARRSTVSSGNLTAIGAPQPTIPWPHLCCDFCRAQTERLGLKTLLGLPLTLSAVAPPNCVEVRAHHACQCHWAWTEMIHETTKAFLLMISSKEVTNSLLDVSYCLRFNFFTLGPLKDKGISSAARKMEQLIILSLTWQSLKLTISILTVDERSFQLCLTADVKVRFSFDSRQIKPDRLHKWKVSMRWLKKTETWHHHVHF